MSGDFDAASLRRPGALWLDCGAPTGCEASWSALAGEPALWVTGRDDELRIEEGPAGHRGWLRSALRHDPGSGSAFERLAAVARGLASQGSWSPGGFTGGFAGMFSYDLGWSFERLPRRLPSDGWPDFQLGLYDAPSRAAGPTALPSGAGTDAAPRSELDPATHGAAVEAVRAHIAAGDLYQANVTLRFKGPWEGDELAALAALRRLNPSPFGAWMRLPAGTIASSSPELFLAVDSEGLVRSRPIKGTAPRGADPIDDRALRDGLLCSAKDRAELTMIVDLMRNDIGRACRPGSVSRSAELIAEAHPTVWHLVGDVQGELAAGRDVWDLLRATFPPGSCIGAPKIRAMTVLEGLEASRRGPYTGALGWVGLNGEATLSVAIRTLTFRDGLASYGVGGGIVHDSQPNAEWDEALLKGRALGECLGGRALALDGSPVKW